MGSPFTEQRIRRFGKRDPWYIAAAMTCRVVKLLLLLACVLTLTAAAGCGDPCRDLAGQICICFPDDGTRAVCNQRAKDAESSFPVSQQDKEFCQQKLDSHSCDCLKLATPEGRAGCGLTYP
jgi:hypothetical protein